MSRRRSLARLPSIAALAALATATPAVAQGVPRPGDLLRIVLRSDATRAAPRVRGTLVRTDGDTLVLRPTGATDPAVIRVPLADIRTLRLRSPRSRTEGARVGALAGLGAGLAASAVWITGAAAYDRAHPCVDVFVPCRERFYATLGSYLLTTVATGVGAGVGALAPGHTWRRTPAAWLRATAVQPVIGPRGLGLVARF